MVNKDIALVLVKAREGNKWAPVRYLVQYGLFERTCMYLEDKGYIVTKHDKELGTLVRLTLDGYYTARTVVDTIYNKEGVTA